MKPPTIHELEHIRNRFDVRRIGRGEEMREPLDITKNYLLGGEWVKAEELVRRLVRRCLELEGFVQGELPEPLVWWGGKWMREGRCQEPGDMCLACERLGKHLEPVE